MKIWVDDVRPAPEGEGYFWCKTVLEVKQWIQYNEEMYHLFLKQSNSKNIAECFLIKLIDLDHDAGEQHAAGGDYIEILNWLENTGRNYPIRIHSMNPVGVENMRRIIRRNGWTEVL